jgi:hypothetical protein
MVSICHEFFTQHSQKGDRTLLKSEFELALDVSPESIQSEVRVLSGK